MFYFHYYHGGSVSESLLIYLTIYTFHVPSHTPYIVHRCHYMSTPSTVSLLHTHPYSSYPQLTTLRLVLGIPN